MSDRVDPQAPRPYSYFFIRFPRGSISLALWVFLGISAQQQRCVQPTGVAGSLLKCFEYPHTQHCHVPPSSCRIKLAEFSFVKYVLFSRLPSPHSARSSWPRYNGVSLYYYCRDDISRGGGGSGGGVGAAARQTPFQFRRRTIIITGKLHSVPRFASRPRDASPEIVPRTNGGGGGGKEKPRDNDRSPILRFGYIRGIE